MTRARRLQRLWVGAVKAPLASPLGALRLLFLWPLALMIRGGATIRSLFVGKAESPATPVVSVGSLMVGGAGKTPFVRWLAQQLMERGLSVGIVCAGYGRAGRDQILGSGADLSQRNPSEIGDEVALLAGWLPECMFAVDADKVRAAARLSEAGNLDVIIVDDGFQTRRLERDLDVVLLNSEAPLSSYRLFPAGALREGLSELKRANELVYSKLASEQAQPESWLSARIENLTKRAVWRSWTVTEVASPDSATLPALDAPALLVSALADNNSFRHAAERAGVAVAGFVEFPDHFDYDETALAEIRRRAVECEAGWLLTSEKDWVKLRRTDWPLPCAVLRQRVEVSDGAALSERVVAVIAAHNNSKERKR